MQVTLSLLTSPASARHRSLTTAYGAHPHLLIYLMLLIPAHVLSKPFGVDATRMVSDLLY